MARADGGRGNFGVVTRFKFALHAVGPLVTAGLIVFPAAQGREVLRRYREHAATLADDVSVWAVLRRAPPLPFLPPAVHGQEIVAPAVFSPMPTPECEIFIGLIGGRANVPGTDATAYPHRDVAYAMNVHGRWRDAADDARCIGWARGDFTAVAPFAAGSVYINFLTQDEGARIREAYGPNWDRLVQIKRRYDPDNLFRFNHNIAPGG